MTEKNPKSPKPRVKVDRRKLVLAAKKKQQCIAKAQKIVEEFVEENIHQEDHFLTQLRWINQTHYQDIVEERAITKLCGYALCCEKLGNIPKKKYHISCSENKVYDITDRKNFCSNQCYKASLFVKNQLFTSPLWLRDKEPIVKFKLFKGKIDLIGEEIAGFENSRICDPDYFDNFEKCVGELEHLTL